MSPSQKKTNGWLLRVQHTLRVTAGLDKVNRQLSKKIKNIYVKEI